MAKHNYSLHIVDQKEYTAAANIANAFGYRECEGTRWLPCFHYFWLMTSKWGSDKPHHYFATSAAGTEACHADRELVKLNSLAELEQILRQITQQSTPTTQETAIMALKTVSIVRRTLTKDNKVIDKIIHTSEPINNASENGMLIATAAAIAPSLKDIPADELVAFFETKPEAK